LIKYISSYSVDKFILKFVVLVLRRRNVEFSIKSWESRQFQLAEDVTDETRVAEDESCVAGKPNVPHHCGRQSSFFKPAHFLFFIARIFYFMFMYNRNHDIKA
jgi:hypothetical protein